MRLVRGEGNPVPTRTSAGSGAGGFGQGWAIARRTKRAGTKHAGTKHAGTNHAGTKRDSTKHDSGPPDRADALMSEPVQEGAPGAALDDDMLGTLARLSSQFFADAAAVDSAASVPVAHLDALAAAGLYGIFAPVSEGGLGLGYPETCAAVEELASSCLASTFVWAQHFSFLRAMLDPTTPAPLRSALLAPAVRGEIKGGVALTGLLPGPARLTAEPAHPWMAPERGGTVGKRLGDCRSDIRCGPGSRGEPGVPFVGREAPARALCTPIAPFGCEREQYGAAGLCGGSRGRRPLREGPATGSCAAAGGAAPFERVVRTRRSPEVLPADRPVPP